VTATNATLPQLHEPNTTREVRLALSNCLPIQRACG
jgi:hypothetical protein